MPWRDVICAVMQQSSRSLTFVVVTVALSFAAGTAFDGQEQDQARFEIPGDQRQLFLDEQGVAELTKLTRTRHRPVKKGAVIEPDQPWKSVLQIRCAPVWDAEQERYQFWPITTPTSTTAGHHADRTIRAYRR